MADIPERTTHQAFVITPRMVQHCNARTGYKMFAHWFNPNECFLCADLIDIIGKDAIPLVPDTLPFDANNRYRNGE